MMAAELFFTINRTPTDFRPPREVGMKLFLYLDNALETAIVDCHVASQQDLRHLSILIIRRHKRRHNKVTTRMQRQRQILTIEEVDQMVNTRCTGSRSA